MTTAVPTCEKVELSSLGNGSYGSVEPVLEKYETALLLLLGFGGISILLAVAHRLVRTYVYHDVDNVDVAFDAGGRVSTSLTAVTVASQFLWPGDFLQSSTITVKSGVSGPFWYTVGAALNIALFPIVSVYLKTRAPGAKTYLQIMRARYGSAAHVVFICMALLVNLCVISTLLVAGVATIRSYTAEASDEFCVFIIAVLFGSYTFIGGLGTTFYVSYFNLVLIFGVLIALNVKILYTPGGDADSGLGSFDALYDKMSCLLGPEGNEERSYLTFRSENGLVWAFMGLCVTASLTYCDQAAWQSRVAAKPLQGVLGFLIASYIWFAVPVSVATSTGLAYLSLGSDNATNLLSPGDIDAGLVTPFMAQRLLGEAGGILVVTVTAMTLMSTGSGEVIAVASIIVYDIYQVYINPFRKHEHADRCILCDKHVTSGPMARGSEACTCPDVFSCAACKRDADVNTNGKTYTNQYRCEHHGLYRQYQDRMFEYKSWCILWVTAATIPLGLAVIASGIDLNWSMLFGFIITLPCFPPVVMATFWSKTTKAGVISGALFGLVCGVSVALGVASTYEGGLTLFVVNTAQNYSVLAGAGTSMGVSFLATLLVSCGTHSIRSADDAQREWQKLRNIDNPLRPWSELYREDIPDLKRGQRPSSESMDKVFRKAKIVAIIGGLFTLVLYGGVIPGVMIGLHVLTAREFEVWTKVLQFFSFSMAAIVIIVAPIEEVVQIFRTRRENNRKQRANQAHMYAYSMPVSAK